MSSGLVSFARPAESRRRGRCTHEYHWGRRSKSRRTTAAVLIAAAVVACFGRSFGTGQTSASVPAVTTGNVGNEAVTIITGLPFRQLYTSADNRSRPATAAGLPAAGDGMSMPNCTPAAVDQFPQDAFTAAQRRDGAIVLHLIAAAYMFVALAIACDDYFVPSLECICEIMKITPDVAGATFMAAGSSAPELAASVIGVFVAKDDIGLSAVVGSAVFNIMFVIGICGVLAGQVVPLSWWPLVRDCIFYTISIIALVAVIYDERVQMYESLVLLALYVLYILLMYFNGRIESWVHASVARCRKRLNRGTDREAIVDRDHTAASGAGADEMGVSYRVDECNVNIHAKAHGVVNRCRGSHAGDDSATADVGLEATADGANRSGDGSGGGNSESDDPEALESDRMLPRAVVQPLTANGSGSGRYDSSSSRSSDVGGDAEKLGNEEELWSPCQRPPPSWLSRCYWLITYPLKLLLFISTPDCRRRRWRKFFLATFILSCTWIAAFSYLLVWVLTVIGSSWLIPDNVMSLIFLAAGVSIPDAIASYLVVREGEGDMAVSNAVGSNVFDILLCLGLPWLLSTAIFQKDIIVYSSGLTYSSLTLLSTVLFLLVATHVNGWKLDRRFGIILLVVYVVFLALACLYELNIFGLFHLPTCPSRLA